MQKESLIKTTVKNELPYASTNDPISPTRAKEPLPTLQTYCKSKTFIANSGVNPLAAAASALFSLIHKLRRLETCQDLEKTQSLLIHEIKAFECAAQTRGYRADEILIARYLLCATLDEIIHTTTWGKACDWQLQYGLLPVFQGESWGGERFFLILKKLQENSELHHDLLEFAYLCLSLGFQGRYRHLTHGRDDLDQVLDELYHGIRYQQEEDAKKLNNPIKPFKKLPKLMTKPIPLWLIGTLTLTLLTTLYLGLNYVLTLTANPVYKDLSTIMKHHDNP
jgi:type IV/VI secretion system ImpK/VasF family protein